MRILLKRGYVYCSMSEYDKAIDDFSKAIKLKPDAGVYYYRAFAYFHKDEYHRSWEDIQKAESLGYKIDRKFLKDLKKALNGKK